MGLDMYLNRYPRYRNADPDDIEAVENYFDWLERPAEYRESSLKDWCGTSESDLPSKEVIAHYRPYYKLRYYAWDDEHKYGHNYIHEQIGYWRKANAIHQWFVDHVQNGEDDCKYHNEVTKEHLIKLRDTCKDVVENCPLVNGKVKNGYRYENGREIPILEDGKVVMNPAYAAERLPVQDGFFFGNTQYNEWYIEDLLSTIEICDLALETTDFDTQMVYYCSSW